MRRISVTIDAETDRRLKNLSAALAKSKSHVVREAVRRMSEQEGFERYLDWLERQPRIRRSLERGLADIRAGRTLSHEQMLSRLRKPRGHD